MNFHSYVCRCPALPYGHSTTRASRYVRRFHSFIVHNIHRNMQVDDDSSTVATLMTGLTLTDILEGGVPALHESTPVDDDSSTVATLMTGLTLTDEGPAIAKQHSKLWSSSSEFYQSLSPNIPVTMGNVPLNDVQNSIQAILSESIHATPPPLHMNPLIRLHCHHQPHLSMHGPERQKVSYKHPYDRRYSRVNEDTAPSNDVLRVLLENAAIAISSAGDLSSPYSCSQGGVPLPSLLPAKLMFLKGHIYESPVAKLDVIAQVMILLGAVCHIIVGISTEPCDFIINVVAMIVKMAMATTLSKVGNSEPEYDRNQLVLILMVGQQYMLHSMIVFPPMPPILLNAQPHHWASDPFICNAELLEVRNGHPRPIKPFVVASFTDYLAQSLADPEVERLSKQACDDAMINIDTPPDETTNIFNAQFMKSFEGPVPGQLFVDRGVKVRIAFAMHVDFFNPNGTKRRGNHDSIGIISLANLNLPETIRYRPEHIFLVGVIPGPKECNLEEINHFIRPVIDQLEIGWKRGFHISRTADSPESGEDVEVAVVLSVNDLPAARKVSGTAGHGSDFLCTVCDGYKRCNLYNTDFENWRLRNVDQMREQAQASRDADTPQQGMEFSKHTVMHCILEGIVHYHCRSVLCIDAVEAKAAEPQILAFSHPWTQYSSADAPVELRDFSDIEIKHVSDIQKQLCLPSTVVMALQENLRSLKFVFSDLQDLPNVSNMFTTQQGVLVPAKTKLHFATLLVKWRLTMPLNSPSAVPKTCTTETLQYIQHVIRTTSTPSWIHSVPTNYGEASAGSIKADEWRILSTVYLPIALVTLWGDRNGAPPPEGSHFLKLLDHTMALFQAVTLVVLYTMNTARAGRYRDFIKVWTDGLHTLHPHTKEHKNRVNVHAAFHIYDFLLLFGPRLIGALQKINTNDIVGGPLEHTMLRAHMRAAGLRRG
ncbi:hypothetical protein Hypma_001411 [Hypsizygus marmoreus]|uniref:Uncharacterized protein n=1 Tax=Hypsizygus marmoreus TaxID=39966 RepID=A0A369K6I4_HYPMA|nr:hypothetical protein Hypma_001411 [Hypsizygus marmoreus]